MLKMYEDGKLWERHFITLKKKRERERGGGGGGGEAVSAQSPVILTDLQKMWQTTN